MCILCNAVHPIVIFSQYLFYSWVWALTAIQLCSRIPFWPSWYFGLQGLTLGKHCYRTVILVQWYKLVWTDLGVYLLMKRFNAYQLDQFKNHLGEKLLHKPLVCKGLILVGWPTLNVGGTILRPGVLERMKRRKHAEQECSYFSACCYVMWRAALNSCHHDFPAIVKLVNWAKISSSFFRLFLSSGQSNKNSK